MNVYVIIEEFDHNWIDVGVYKSEKDAKSVYDKITKKGKTARLLVTKLMEDDDPKKYFLVGLEIWANDYPNNKKVGVKARSQGEAIALAIAYSISSPITDAEPDWLYTKEAKIKLMFAKPITPDNYEVLAGFGLCAEIGDEEPRRDGELFHEYINRLAIGE
jgi:hypothetical protein